MKMLHGMVSAWKSTFSIKKQFFSEKSGFSIDDYDFYKNCYLLWKPWFKKKILGRGMVVCLSQTFSLQ